MIKIYFSSKLSSILGLTKKIASIDKQSRKWEEFTEEEQRKYLREHPASKKQLTGQHAKQQVKPQSDFDMSVDEILDSINKYQNSESSRVTRDEFKKLYKNFMPMIMATIREVIGSRQADSEARQDILSAANTIFVRALENADFNNKGIVEYMKTTLTKQLRGKARDTFRSTVSIGPSDRRLQRKVYKYINDFESKNGYTPTDYEQIARDIASDPSGKYTYATPGLISDLMQSGAVSLEEEVGERSGDDSRKMMDVLGPSGIRSGVESDVGFTKTPEEETIASEMRDAVLKSISSSLDPLQEKIVRMYYGLMPGEEQGKEKDIKEIAVELNMSRNTVKRQFDSAHARLSTNPEIKRLRHSKSIARIILAHNKHIRLEYVPDSITKIGSNYIVNNVIVKKYGHQLVCDCGNENCSHKDIVKSLKD